MHINITFAFLFQSCDQGIRELFSDKIYILGIVALVVAVIMVRSILYNYQSFHVIHLNIYISETRHDLNLKEETERICFQL